MPDLGSYDKLLYQHELLRTRLKIREHFLGTMVKEVYENIGQMLSLIRVKLSTQHYGFEAGKNETIDSSGEMVGKTINDLRSMCRLFYPEEEIMNSAGFYRVIGEEIKKKFPEAVYINDNNTTSLPVLSGEKGLIVFGILLEIIDEISNVKNGKLVSVIIKCNDNTINFTLSYLGNVILKKTKKITHRFFDLSVFERTKLLYGSLEIKNKEHDNRWIKLEVPIN